LPLGKHLETAGVPASALKLWFARILRDAWALEVPGQYQPFREVAGGALEVLIAEQGGKVGKLGVPASEVTLLAAHAWDVHGARRAGLRGAWVGRLEKKFEPAMGQPDLAADSIAELVEKL
jgi:hypothetical protein